MVKDIALIANTSQGNTFYIPSLHKNKILGLLASIYQVVPQQKHPQNCDKKKLENPTSLFILFRLKF